MPIYEIEQYETWTTKYRVEAETVAGAVKKILDGKAEPVDDSNCRFIEINEDIGLPHEELTKAEFRDLAKLGLIGEAHVKSIRSILKVSDEKPTKKKASKKSKDDEDEDEKPTLQS